MANTLDSMDLKQIISLHEDGLSNRQISVTLGIVHIPLKTDTHSGGKRTVIPEQNGHFSHLLAI